MQSTMMNIPTAVWITGALLAVAAILALLAVGIAWLLAYSD